MLGILRGLTGLQVDPEIPQIDLRHLRAQIRVGPGRLKLRMGQQLMEVGALVQSHEKSVGRPDMGQLSDTRMMCAIQQAGIAQ